MSESSSVVYSPRKTFGREPSGCRGSSWRRLVVAGRVDAVRGSASDRKHHAIVTQIETVETHVDPLALDRLRSQVEQEVEIKAVVKLQLDTGRAVVDIERLVDVALTVAADHLALDVVFRSLGPLHEAVELGLLGRAGSELEGLGRGEIVVGSRIGDRAELLLHLLDGDRSKPHCGHIVVHIEFLRSRSVEIVVAAHGHQTDESRQCYFKTFHKLCFARLETEIDIQVIGRTEQVEILRGEAAVNLLAALAADLLIRICS